MFSLVRRQYASRLEWEFRSGFHWVLKLASLPVVERFVPPAPGVASVPGVREVFWSEQVVAEWAVVWEVRL
jgi:hypothetical protein